MGIYSWDPGPHDPSLAGVRTRLPLFDVRMPDPAPSEGANQVGILKRLLNLGNAEGVREAMRASYRKHRKMAERGPADSNLSPHHVGLFGCLASRLQTQGYLPPEPSIWDDLLPFIALSDEETAVEAVAEYVIAMEEVDDGRHEFLLSMIRQGIKTLMADRARAGAFHLSKPLWFLLLDEEERTRVLDWMS